MKPELTENAKKELAFNWTGPQPIPEGEPDIPQSDSVPSIIDQAKSQGWKCEYYSFGKLDDQGTDYFNPSLVLREDGIWLLTRASGLHPRGFMYGQNQIVAFKLDDVGKQPHHGKVLHWNDALQLQHFEDPRGFYHPRLGQTMMGCCTFMWNGPGDWTGALQVFGAFDNDWVCKKVDYPKIGGNPGKVEKVLPKHYEKNWVWWLHEERLHLLYKANPWTVYTFENRWSERVEYKLEALTWPWGEIRGGTPPVQVGDLFFTFHHSSLPWKGRYRRYYAGCIGFETTPPYRPRLITSEPILQGSQNDIWAQRKPLVVFPCGALHLNNHWLISMGVNDMKAAWLELPHESLLQRMKPIEDVTGQIFQSAIPSALILSGSGEAKLNAEPDRLNALDTQQAAQTTLEKRRAALVKARAARAAKRVSSGDTEGGKVAADAEVASFQPSSGEPRLDDTNGDAPSARPTKRQFSPEALERLRAAAAKARAARAAKRLSVQNGEIATAQPKKRKKRRKIKRIKPERQREALQEYEKSLAKEEVKG